MHTSRTLLFTDIVDSTTLAGQLGDDAAAAFWARHDRGARDLLRHHRGREIDRADGFLLLFEGPDDALGFAADYHGLLGGLGVRARVGLHHGPVVLRDNSADDVALGAKPLEVDGLAKPVAARIMAVAGGGQTLLSDAARRALTQAGRRLHSHGHWRLKGVDQPVELFEAGDQGAAFVAPADGPKAWRVVREGEDWRPAREIPHRLPSESDTFVGREQDLALLAERLDGEARLVSLLGVGGAGKSRLAVRYARAWLGEWPGGAWFCDLAEARDPVGIAAACARALGVALNTADPLRHVGDIVAGRGRCLVILDNFEQVARHADQTVGAWLDMAPQARFLVTTREVLGIPGEVVVGLPPLPEAAAVSLLQVRAEAAGAALLADPAEQEATRALVRLLDGLPLAIELAAARLRVMRPTALIARMGRRFELLAASGGRRDRRATLRATLDWSWELLDPDEQQGLACLAVFEGGFDLDAVEAVLDDAHGWPADVLQRLVDKSLVRGVDGDRFDLFMSVREYAWERLVALGGQAQAELRHGAWYARLGVDELVADHSGEADAARRRALHRELDNLVAACRRAVARGDGAIATACLRGAWADLYQSGPYQLGADLAVQVLAQPGLLPAERVSALLVAAEAHLHAGHVDAAEDLLRRALDEAPGAGLLRHQAQATATLGLLLHMTGRRDQAEAVQHDALERARATGAVTVEAKALSELGALAMGRGRPTEARRCFEAALVLYRARGDRRGEGIALGNLSKTMSRADAPEEMLSSYRAAIDVHREVGNRRGEASVMGNLAGRLSMLGRVEEARRLYEASLALHQQIGNRRDAAAVKAELTRCSALDLEPELALSLGEQSVAELRQLRDRSLEAIALAALAERLQRLGRLAEAAHCIEQAMAIRLGEGDRMHMAMARLTLAAITRRQGRPDEARALLAACQQDLAATEDRTMGVFVLGEQALVELDLGELDAALEHARPLAAQLGASRNNRAEALLVLASVHLARAEVAQARVAVDAARAAWQGYTLGARIAATDALVLLAEGAPDRAHAALAEATAHPALCAEGSDVARLVARARQQLAERVGASPGSA